MKNLLYLFLALTLACSNEANDDNSESLLLGEWQYDSNPGYGDPTFYEDGRVKFHYFSEAWGDNFSEWGDWTLSGSSLKIFWDESDPGLEVYDTTVLELTTSKLVWKVDIDGELSQESFTKQ
jgi:hypothetical protein